jgi:hypothetical protein
MVFGGQIPVSDSRQETEIFDPLGQVDKKVTNLLKMRRIVFLIKFTGFS